MKRNKKCQMWWIEADCSRLQVLRGKTLFQAHASLTRRSCRRLQPLDRGRNDGVSRYECKLSNPVACSSLNRGASYAPYCRDDQKDQSSWTMGRSDSQLYTTWRRHIITYAQWRDWWERPLGCVLTNHVTDRKFWAYIYFAHFEFLIQRIRNLTRHFCWAKWSALSGLIWWG